MDMTTGEVSRQDDIPEVRIVSGIEPADVENLLNMAAASGLFTSDVMMTAEDMAWESAYGSGSEMHTFFKAVIADSGSDRIIGFICFGPVPHWPGNYEMYGIAVEPEYQRLGIGSALLSESFRRIAFERGHRLYLETGTNKIFENSRRFYEANNFIQQHRYIKQFTPNDGGIVYCYDIAPNAIDEHHQ